MFSRIRSSFNKRLLLLLPYFLIAILLILVPIILIVVNAFTYTAEPSFDSAELVKDIKTWTKIWRSTKMGFFSALLCFLIGFPYAYFVSQSESKILPIYAMSLILSPMMIFTIAKIYAVRGFALSLTPNENSLNAVWFLVIGLTYLNLPYMIMPLYSVFKDMPKNMIEASHDLGYDSFKTLFKIILPYSWKAILSGFAMIFLAGATGFIISDKLLPDGSQHQTIGSVVNKYTNPSNKYEVALGTTLALVVSALFIGIYGIINFIPKYIAQKKRGR